MDNIRSIFASFIVCIVVTTNLFGQHAKLVDYSAIYEFVSPVDTVTLKLSKPNNFLLIGNSQGSRFQAANQHFNDSMTFVYSQANPEIDNFETQEEMQDALDNFTVARAKWIKPVTANYFVEKHFEVNQAKIKLIPPFPPQHLEIPLLSQWNITNNTDTIASFHCQIANIQHGGRHYTAWFTTQIPISDGPYVFSGLPGLILKITDSRGWFTFRLKSFNTNPAKMHWKENFFNPFSKAIARKSFVDQSSKHKNEPRIFGALQETEEDLLKAKRAYAWRYYLLIEQR